MKKGLNFLKTSNPNTLTFFFSTIKDFKNFNLMHPQPFDCSKMTQNEEDTIVKSK
jgi:hypothetical protein